MISAVIVTYESAACVGRCISSLRQRLPGLEIIVVDNDSRDGTISAARDADPDARVIESGDNVGFGRACNMGAGAARGSHLLFINPDVVLTGSDEARLRDLLGERPFGLAAPAFEEEAGRERPERSWKREVISHTLETVRPREWKPRRRRSKAGEVWVSGGLLLVLKEEFLALGGFDPRFFLYYEDRDLSRRYREAALPIRETTAIRGRHSQGTSSASDGLRAGPMAWSLLGWLEYVFIREGAPAARHAATATWSMLRVLSIGVRLFAIFGIARAGRKACQLDRLLGIVADEASVEDPRYCREALLLLRGVIGARRTASA